MGALCANGCHGGQGLVIMAGGCDGNAPYGATRGSSLCGIGAAMRIFCALCGACSGGAGRLPYAGDDEGSLPYGQGFDIRRERGSPARAQEGRGGGGRLAATVQSLI